MGRVLVKVWSSELVSSKEELFFGDFFESPEDLSKYVLNTARAGGADRLHVDGVMDVQ